MEARKGLFNKKRAAVAKKTAGDKGDAARGEAVQKQQEQYVSRAGKTDAGKSAGKRWSVRQFGKRLQQWNKMSEAGKK